MSSHNGAPRCVECDQPIDGVAFCGNCGAPATALPAAVATVPEPDPTQDPAAPSAEPSPQATSPNPPDPAIVVAATESDDNRLDIATPTNVGDAMQDVATSPDATTADTTPTLVDDADELVIFTPTTVPTPVPKSSWWRRRRVIGLVVPVTLLALIVGACVMALALTSQRPASTTTPTATPRVASVVEGWAGEASWERTTDGTVAAVTRDGRAVVVADDTGAVEVLDAESGKVLSTWETEGVSSVRAATIDGAAGAVAATDTEIAMWADVTAPPVVLPLPNGMTVAVRRDGTVLVVAADQSNASISVVTGTALVPFASPLAGASPLTVTTEGSMLWASARGVMLNASQPGTVINTITPATPSPGATISSWVGVFGAHLYLQWALPDGSTVLTGHSTTDGTLTGSSMVDPNMPLVPNQTLTAAMLGNTLIDLTSGAMSVPEPTFAAAVGLGTAFYGATGAEPALLIDGHITPLGRPTVSPRGFSTDGQLIALTGNTIAAYPSADDTSPAPDAN